MAASVCVFISCFNESEEAVAHTLSSLVPGVATGLVGDVTIVAHRDSLPDMNAVADAAGCELRVPEGNLASGLQEAAKSSRAPWLLFMPAGLSFDAGWHEEAMTFIQRMPPDRPKAALFAHGRSPFEPNSLMVQLQDAARRMLGRGEPPAVMIMRSQFDRLGASPLGGLKGYASLVSKLRGKTLQLRSRIRRN